MKHSLGAKALTVATLVFSGLALLGQAAPPAVAAATGPNVTVQVNGIEGRIDGGDLQLGAEGEPTVHGSGLAEIDCPSLAPGEMPANSIGAALLALNANWSVTGRYGKLNFEGKEYPMESLGFGAPGTGWQLWIDERYVDLGLVGAGAFCEPLHDDQTVVLQASELIVNEEGSPYYLPATPHIQVEGLPATVAVGQPFAVTVAVYTPLQWGGSGLGKRTVGPGYSLSFDGGSPLATDANGQVTLTATKSDSGKLSMVALAGADPQQVLPTAAGNSAFSVPAGICVYDGTAGSPCATGELSAPAIDFAEQALGSTGPPHSIPVTPALGTLGDGRITGVEVIGADPDDFLVSSNECAGVSIDSGTPAVACAVGVRFSPSAGGSRSATLVVSSTTTNGSVEIPLSGTGVALPGGAAGEPGAPGDTGPTGATGQTGATGRNGAPGAPGRAGVKGASGRRGPAGRDAACKVKRGTGAPRITCTLKAHGARAALTRNGRTYARGTVASLRATRAVPAGRYTLRYRVGSHERAVAITLG